VKYYIKYIVKACPWKYDIYLVDFDLMRETLIYSTTVRVSPTDTFDFAEENLFGDWDNYDFELIPPSELEGILFLENI